MRLDDDATSCCLAIRRVLFQVLWLCVQRRVVDGKERGCHWEWRRAEYELARAVRIAAQQIIREAEAISFERERMVAILQ